MSVDRTRLPPLGPEPPFTFPDILRRTLSSGLRVWTVEHHAVPLVSIIALLPAGASTDPAGRPGLAALTGDLLDEGCGALDAMAFHEAIGRIGAQLETEVGADAAVAGITTLTRFAAPGLQLLRDMIVYPRLESSDFERVRDLRLNRLVQLRDTPPALAERAFAQLLYGPHPYGHLPIGTEESLEALTIDDVHAFHRRMYDPSRLTVIGVGAASHKELGDLIEEAFGGWRPHAGSKDVYPDVAALLTPPVPPTRLALVHRPDAAQSELRIGHVSVPRSTPDYHALLVMNLVLGGQFVSRINMKLREEKGYTYGARTSFDFRRGPGPFVLQVSVQSDATVDAIDEALSELRAIRGERPITTDELELGRAAVTRGYPRNFETAEQVGRAAAQLALYGLADDYFSTFVPRVLALTDSDLTRAAATHIDPDRLVTVIVGDREKVHPSIERLGFGEPAEVGAMA
jgi:predicted Zn-dependent peptidase